jgi:glycosyltransferase involved in cell wall biosynthesis
MAQPEQHAKLTSLFINAHFLFVPSRAEAFGMVFCEANAFGIPAIATATGGTCTIIRDGVNGYALPLSAGPPEYAKLIGAIAADELEYRRLAESSFAEFEERLNWKAWIGRYMEVAKLIALGNG